MKQNHLDIENINIAKVVWMALTHRVTFVAAWRLFASAMTEFFIPQFQTRFRLSKRPVVSVDHPLDETIPFRPEHIDIYLHFYPLWIKGMYFIYKEFGKQTLPRISDFMNELADIYYEAGKVYRVCQSTTVRPLFLKTAQFRLLHLVDPHLHCVPSLHVLLVVFNHRRIGEMIDQFSNGNGNYQEQKDYTYTQAVSITNSILFLKQHSVNCIPAALFAMSSLYPEYTGNEAASFIDDLLRNVSLDTSDQIKEFVHTQYRMFMDSSSEDGYRGVLLDYLHSCKLATK